LPETGRDGYRRLRPPHGFDRNPAAPVRPDASAFEQAAALGIVGSIPALTYDNDSYEKFNFRGAVGQVILK